MPSVKAVYPHMTARPARGPTNRDRSGGTPEDSADAHGDGPDQDQVQGSGGHGSRDAGISDRQARVLRGQHPLADQERQHTGDESDHGDHRTERRDLGGEHQAPLRRRAESRFDGADGVLGRHDQHAQDSKGELGQATPAKL